jgi:hypothetical protein
MEEQGETMAPKADYTRKMHAMLEEWNHEIRVMTEKADWIAADLREQYQFDLEVLKVKLAHGREKLQQIDEAGEEAWEDLRAGLEVAWAAIVECFDSIRSRFRQI